MRNLLKTSILPLHMRAKSIFFFSSKVPYDHEPQTKSQGSLANPKLSKNLAKKQEPSGDLATKQPEVEEYKLDPLELTKEDIVKAVLLKKDEVPEIYDASELPPSDILIDDYSQTPDRISPNNIPGMSINGEIDILTRGNELAEQVLKSMEIDLANKDIHVKSLDAVESVFLTQDHEKISQINLGEVKTIPSSGILLEDVDPQNIPDDLEIIFNPYKSELTAIGVEVPLEKDQAYEIQTTEGMSLEDKAKQSVAGNIFHEKSNKEFKDEIFNPFERMFGWFSSTTTFRFFILTFPIFLFFDALTETFLELYLAKKSHFLIEQQEINALIKNKESLMMEYQASQTFKK